MTQIQSAGVSGILLVEGKALVLRRAAHDSEPGYWEFVKGKVEFGEAPKEAIIREYKEETGLNVEIKGILDIFSWTYQRADKKHHVIEVVYEVVLAARESIQNLELEDHDKSQMADYESAKLLEPMVDDRRGLLLKSLQP